MFDWFLNKPQKLFIKGKYYAVESETCLELSQISTMELFCENVTDVSQKKQHR